MLGRLLAVLEGRIGNRELDLSKLGRIDRAAYGFGNTSVPIRVDHVMPDHHPVRGLALERDLEILAREAT